MKIYQVGGSVRDELLGVQPKDKDYVVVGATPEEMLERGFKQVGADFPVFLHPETGDEYALARTERKTGPGYSGFETRFDPSITLEEDLLRRDLTINAMAKAYGPDVFEFSNEIIDPYGGRKDLEDGILRHVSPAFAEDPVRVLRVARFAARYGFQVAPTTLCFMLKMVIEGELDHLTEERVWAETEKAMMEDSPATYFDILDQCDALMAVMPQLEGCDSWFVRPLEYAAQEMKAGIVERFAILTADLNEQYCIAFYEQLKAPNNISRLAIKVNRVLPYFMSNLVYTAEQIMQVFNKIDAFRDDDALRVVINTLIALDSSVDIDRLSQAYSVAHSMSFADLTEDQRNTLKGLEIGEAIEQLRLNTIKEIFGEGNEVTQGTTQS